MSSRYWTNRRALCIIAHLSVLWAAILDGKKGKRAKEIEQWGNGGIPLVCASLDKSSLCFFRTKRALCRGFLKGFFIALALVGSGHNVQGSDLEGDGTDTIETKRSSSNRDTSQKYDPSSLPSEILHGILVELDLASLSAVAQTSKRFASLVGDDYFQRTYCFFKRPRAYQDHAGNYSRYFQSPWRTSSNPFKGTTTTCLWNFFSISPF